MSTTPSRAADAKPHGAEEYYPLFDYLRIVLASGVFFVHSHVCPLPGSTGNALVQVFFALSGFLIGGILLNSRASDLPRFYFNRTTRIWIPYAVALLLLFALTAVRQNLRDAQLWKFFFYKATFVYNIFGAGQLACAEHMPLQGTGNHFWSICVEEQFYLLAPIFMVLARRLRVVWLVAVFALNFIYPHGYAAIALGVLLAISRHHFGAWYLGRAATVVLLAVGVAAFGLLKYDSGMPVLAVVIVAVLARNGPKRPLGVWLGGISYPFYLNHWVGLYLHGPLDHRLHLGMVPSRLIEFAVAFGFNAVLYSRIDRRVLSRRSAWYTPRIGRTATLAGITLVLTGLIGGLLLRG
jgi:peptidoglycan/LPS O-acetylase OafA/YrhL